MKTAAYLFKNGQIIKSKTNQQPDEKKCQLVIGFGEKSILVNCDNYKRLQLQFPNAEIALCSTAGEIYENEVLDNTLTITAVEFEKTKIETASINISSFNNSYSAGAELITRVNHNNLKYVLVLSDGGMVNGSELVRGMESIINHQIPITGGLAGDGTEFKETLVGLNETPTSGNIIAIGFYGDNIRIGHGSMGGWEMFGLEKKITKSKSNELFEIDNSNALNIYKEYLGKYASELPSSALLFPLSIKLSDDEAPIVRTILSINNETNSMVFAGDVPEGAKVRFMKANFDELIEAASDAAQSSLSLISEQKPKLALLISCVGRKIILDKRVDEEVEAVNDILGKDIVTMGFYSYGEISPITKNGKCELHNQTMTITTFNEI